MVTHADNIINFSSDLTGQSTNEFYLPVTATKYLFTDILNETISNITLSPIGIFPLKLPLEILLDLRIWN